MSRITEIRLAVGRTINLGNYETVRLEAGVTVAVDEGDDLDAVKAALQPELRNLMEATWKAQRKQKGDQP